MLGVRYFVRIFAVSLLCLSQVSQAQSPAGVLSKDELQKLVVGKTVAWTRARDGLQITWGIGADQTLNAGYRRVGGRLDNHDSGTWELQDNGGICMKWKSVGDKPCAVYFFRKQDAKYFVHSSSTQPDAPALGEVGSIY